ncbi:MAG TPA: extracellular solute-binding protein [Ktedonobacteraceae bacterium]|nr:extracellular solute-binding protein [Ktedonobacteraceae bacterium]
MKVLHAGSLTTLVRQRLGPAMHQASDITLESESGHSVALASAIKEGRTSGDVFLSADAEVNKVLLGPTNGDVIRWFVIFARNAVVLAYSPQSKFLADFEQARNGAIPWYQVLLQPGVQIRRNDPNLDPMGYYTLLVCALAEEYYNIPDLKERLLGNPTNPEQINQPGLVQLERGETDAMFLYLSAAADRGLPYLRLPDEINLSNPAMATAYARVQYTTDSGQTFHGKPISFSAAVLNNARNPQAALHFVEYLLSPAGQQLVQATHFLPGQALVGGDASAIPDRLRPHIQGEYQQYPG